MKCDFELKYQFNDRIREKEANSIVQSNFDLKYQNKNISEYLQLVKIY